MPSGKDEEKQSGPGAPEPRNPPGQKGPFPFVFCLGWKVPSDVLVLKLPWAVSAEFDRSFIQAGSPRGRSLPSLHPF